MSESGYYAWRARTPSARELRRAWLTDVITDIHRESGGAFGYRRIGQQLLCRYGISVSHATVESLMKRAGICGRTGRLHAPDRRPGPRSPGDHWIVDVQAFTTRRRPLYSAVVLDAASRGLMGWSTAESADRPLVHRAVMAAITRAAGTVGADGSDGTGLNAQRSPLACSFTQRARALGCAPAHGAVGNWYDHAVVNAFWDSVHRELDEASPRPDPGALEERLGKTFDHFARPA
ncbi:IS3 family transposase [Streptomyces sp. MK7]|uniref:IS3 family transposase n=1 Tax=Streptomyces sp. MK7 TaxID=3067635 RepID=UPI00292E30AE|nr:IS3 family transposase [Streptomyces sp. MK7]